MKNLLFGLLFLAGSTGFAQVQYLDSSFHYTGLQDSIATDSGLAQAGLLNEMALQADGKILVAQLQQLEPKVNLLRLNADGSRDLTFGINGSFIEMPAGSANARLLDIYAQSNGKILLGISTNLSMGGTTNMVYRLLTDGTLDTTFGTAGRVNVGTLPLNRPGWICKILVRPNGKIIVCGGVMSTVSPYALKNMLAQYFADGRIDSAFGTNGIVTTALTRATMEPLAALLQEDGKVIMGGEYRGDMIFEGGSPYVVRFDTTGTIDFNFGDDGYYLDYSGGSYGIGTHHIALQSTGKIVFSTGPSGSQLLLRRLLSNGKPDTTFAGRGTYRRSWAPESSGGYVNTNRLQVLDNDTLLVVYNSITANAGDNFTLRKITPDGETDSSWGDNGIAYADFWGQDDKFRDFAVQPDGKIIVCGSSINNDGTGYAYPSIARFKIVPRTRPNSIFTPAYFAGKLKLYPNPATNSVRIEGSFAGDKVTVWNIMGQVVFVQKMTTADLETGALPAGLYQVLVQRNGAVVGSGKLVKE